MAAPPPPGINLNADIRASVIGVDITLVAIATFFVALRFLARYTSKLAIQWDDYLIVLALVSPHTPDAKYLLPLAYVLC